MNVIFWNDTTRPRYASINPDCGLTFAEIAALTVPAGLEWSEMPLDQAMAIVAPYDAIDRRQFMSMSFAQLLIGLVAEGWLTEADALLWLTGVLPPQVQATISLLPEENRFPATARASRPSEVVRTDPLVEMMALAQGRTAAELDAFFEAYSAV